MTTSSEANDENVVKIATSSFVSVYVGSRRNETKDKTEDFGG